MFINNICGATFSDEVLAYTWHQFKAQAVENCNRKLQHYLQLVAQHKVIYKLRQNPLC